MATDGTRTRNRRGEGTQLRSDIVRAATELLDAGGTEKDVTLRAVARQAGISAPSIYPHFTHVDAILLAVAQAAFDELRLHLHGADADASTGGPVPRLRAVCSAYLAFARDRPHRYRVMFAGVWNARDATARTPGLEQAATLGADAFEVLVEAVRRCVESGGSAGVDPAGDATALWVGLHGLAGLRTAAPLFPWPQDIEDSVVGRLARLQD